MELLPEFNTNPRIVPLQNRVNYPGRHICLSAAEVREVLCSYRAHLSHGQTDRLQHLAREGLVLRRKKDV